MSNRAFRKALREKQQQEEEREFHALTLKKGKKNRGKRDAGEEGVLLAIDVGVSGHHMRRRRYVFLCVRVFITWVRVCVHTHTHTHTYLHTQHSFKAHNLEHGNSYDTRHGHNATLCTHTRSCRHMDTLRQPHSGFSSVPVFLPVSVSCACVSAFVCVCLCLSLSLSLCVCVCVSERQSVCVLIPVPVSG